MLAPLAAAPLQALARPPDAGRAAASGCAGRSAASAAALVALAVAVPHTVGPTRRTQPAWLDPALSALPPGTKVLDDWDWGGYLMWRYPQLDLVMHGYGDTFTDDELERNTDIEVGPGLGGGRCARAGARVAVLRPGRALAYALPRSEGWTVVHGPTTSSCSGTGAGSGLRWPESGSAG